MLAGRRFILRRPTAAVDSERAIHILPIDAILTITSDACTEERMIEVVWEKRKLAMFGSDLVERGKEVFQADATELERKPVAKEVAESESRFSQDNA